MHKALFEPSECLWGVWGLILNVISPLLQSCWGLSFALGHGVIFCSGSQHLPLNGCLAVSCNFGVLAGEHECKSFYSISCVKKKKKKSKNTLYIPGPRRKEHDPTRDWPCECPGVSSRGVGQQWPAAGSGALSAAVPTWDPLKEVTVISISSTIVWSQVKQ